MFERLRNFMNGIGQLIRNPNLLEEYQSTLSTVNHYHKEAVQDKQQLQEAYGQVNTELEFRKEMESEGIVPGRAYVDTELGPELFLDRPQEAKVQAVSVSVAYIQVTGFAVKGGEKWIETNLGDVRAERFLARKEQGKLVTIEQAARDVDQANTQKRSVIQVQEPQFRKAVEQEEIGATRIDLEPARDQLDRAQVELQESQTECANLLEELEISQYALNKLTERAAALSSVLHTFHPALQNPDALRQFYECVAPYQDEDGFRLYRAAESITGFNLNGSYPYEDARGEFEKADGHKLIGYLEAECFGIVDWDIVPGTSYERATNMEVDRESPEYQAFQKQLYESVLRDMGFGDFLPPSVPQYSAEQSDKELSTEFLQERSQEMQQSSETATAICGMLIYPSGEMQRFSDPDQFLKAYQKELDYLGPNGVSAKTLTDDPSVRKAVDDLIYGEFGEDNPHNLDYYAKRQSIPELEPNEQEAVGLEM